MTLPSGAKLGPYEIQSPLGAGGMGEVYRARDPRLDRTVAIKILPEHLSHSAEAKQRFDREARAISSLSHPNICHLYDVGQQDSTSFLVMEYLEGETLAERLRKGPLPLDQVLKIGTELCEGLEKAHHSGVVHRDLKPGNIMLTKSGAKLMDFGLAKTPAAAVKSISSSNSLATMSQPLTSEGTILGTIQYMSPEQLEGKEADTRSDIFSLGAVLYEMVTGTRAFGGKTTASTIAAILAAEPRPISAIHPSLPAALDHLIQTCLAKDPDERLQTVHDVKLQLRWIAQSPAQAGVAAGKPAASPTATRLAWLLVAALALVVVGGGIAWWSSAHTAPPAMYFSSPLPLIANDVALAADGRTVAVVAYSEQASKYVIWKYEVGSREAVVLPGTEDASHPFWSPDGRAIAFFADGKLKRVDALSGMSAQVLCDAPNGRGGTWNQDGVIVFTPDAFKGLHRISAAGGTPVEITKLDPSRSETSHRWPVFLPDQRHFLFLGANFSGEFDKNAIFVGSLDSNEKHFVVAASSNAAYADPGYLLYVRNNALVAQRFDLRTFTLTGDPRTITDKVQYTPTTDLAVFTASGKGTLAVQTGVGIGTAQLLWFNRNGKQLGSAGPPGLIGNGTVSPDGRRVVFDQMERDGAHWDVWSHDLESDANTRLTFGPGLNQLPVWSPDGKQVLYAAIRKGSWGLHIKNADGSGSERQIADLTTTIMGPWDWSRSGNVLFWKNGELWYLPSPDAQAKPLIRENWIVRNAQLSPDGKWIAYSSNESGNWEIYVTSFPRADNKWQVSRGGGKEPRWRRDGKELFFLSAEGKIIAVPIKATANFEAGSPETLFQTHTRQSISALDRVSYDVSADGQKFLIDTKVDEPNALPLSIILNWTSELEK
ncbi:MAG TPA: protein kinase [Candidatus Sulfotelmatobacter sp.]|nr:protein kinase [Candidatus Sulfotelmatobacter sp.]